MDNVETRIEEPVIKRSSRGTIESVRLVFGPHHFVNVYIENGRVQCDVGMTHHVSALMPPT